ncbi:MAG TPA: glycoside hydrolase family 71/99-like protein [Prolixibacteraceae bacterium]|nr:glycoside hydrolase family 71/99-like protein [Prolixibacteraceae bacterium]HQN92834.1 glycoside hydrolase family 71/99-like protein [Prolixibacteraceae bacterium]
MIKIDGSLLLAGTLWVLGVSLGSCDNGSPSEPNNFNVISYEPVAVQKSNPMATWAHVMPWFETKETSDNGQWGQHWTMGTRNPDKTTSDGIREIASHYYPLTGPYASGDQDIIEYQLLLMKYSGIDGVLIDWYGASDWNDYASNRRNTEAIIEALKKVGLSFAIVYEDRTIPEVIKYDNSTDRIIAAQTDMEYIEENYFSNPQYINIEGKPLLLVFGPEEFHSPDEWDEILAAFKNKPCFITLNGTSWQTVPHSSGEYIWVDNSSIDNKYGSINKFDVFIGGAYPGFNDFYNEGGWGTGFQWSIDFNQGQTLKQNLQKAENSGASYVQLITWNDYGEGTMIEPTKEFGFSLLEIVQEFTGVGYNASHLGKVYDLYQLRKSISRTDDKIKMLDQAFYYLVSLQHEKANQLIDSVKNIQ